MKKLFTLLCAAVVALSASAATGISAKRSEKKQIPAEFTVPARQIGQSIFSSRQVRRAVAGDPARVVASAECQLYKGVWYLDAYDASDKLVVEFAFANGKEDQIAGLYNADNKSAMVFHVPAAGDSVYLNGNFEIAYVSAGAQYPKYRISATGLKDSLNRSFDFDFEAEILAIDYQKYYYAENYSEYCGVYVDCDYVIELDDAPVVPTGDTIRHEFVLPADFSDYTGGDSEGAHWFQAMSKDANYSFSLCINTSTLVGIFGSEDFDTQYTYLYAMADTSEIKIKEYKSATVSQNGDTTIFVTELMASTGDVYIFTQKHFAPSVNQEFTLPAMNGEADDKYLAYYGTVDFAGEDANNAVVLSLNVKEGFVGTYADEEVDLYYCSLTLNGEKQELFSISNVVVAAEEGGFVVTADFLLKSGDLYHVTIHAAYTEPQAIDNTEVELKAVKRFENGQLIIEKNGAKYNVLGAQVR